MVVSIHIVNISWLLCLADIVSFASSELRASSVPYGRGTIAIPEVPQLSGQSVCDLLDAGHNGNVCLQCNCALSHLYTLSACRFLFLRLKLLLILFLAHFALYNCVKCCLGRCGLCDASRVGVVLVFGNRTCVPFTIWYYLTYFV